MSKITHAEVRMYRLGTGDCFAIKLFADAETIFKIMIDAGTWSGSGDHLTPYIQDLKTYLDNYADVLIITHEHKDHVHAFDACEELFTDAEFNVGEIWMGWTENDRTGKVKDWKDDYGEKKKAMGLAAQKLQEAMKTTEFKNQFSGNKDAEKAMGARKVFSDVLHDFADLHLSLDDETKVYKGGLKGMEVVKKKIRNKGIKYFKPGDIISDLGDAEAVKIYVLGPPELHDDVKKEAGGAGESYDHNKELRESGAFGAAILNMGSNGFTDESILPFDEHYMEKTVYNATPLSDEESHSKDKKELDEIKATYNENDWRKIDFDWLYSAGSFALRMNGLTNNLSLAIAIEIEEKGKVMLFPGDAEFGSWASWHKIKWNNGNNSATENTANGNPKHFTEDLLNRTVFYKVAHHLSHNGTARRLGLEMMNHEELTAMATLDYDIINKGWTSTMPNRAIIQELLTRTKGRLMIMNEDKMFFDFNSKVPIKVKIDEARLRMTSREKKNFEENLKETKEFIQYTVKF